MIKKRKPTRKKKVTRKRVQPVKLFAGCYYTGLKVHPDNWHTTRASARNDWYIHYRFYDPQFKHDPKYKNGCQRLIKTGINCIDTPDGRQQVVKALIATLTDELEVRGYNPITGEYMAPVIEEDAPVDYEIPPTTSFISALKIARDKKQCEPPVKLCLTSVIKYSEIAAKQLRFDTVPIADIRRRHIKKLLEHLGVVKKDKWTANNYNHYRAHLRMLFDELVSWDAMENNPIDKHIPKRKHAIAKAKPLTTNERVRVYDKLRRVNFRFWLHMMCFFPTGMRRAEIMRVQGKDVDLVAQKIKAIRKKGKNFIEVEYTIPNDGLLYWYMAMLNCGPDDFVFSIGLLPGPIPISPRQITIRWREWIKKPEGIKSNWYWLKHLYTTELSASGGTKAAAAHNNESEAMIRKHYDVDHDKREHEKKKSNIIQFIPKKAG